MICTKCAKTIKKDDDVCCKLCNAKQHVSCAGMTRGQQLQLKQNDSWLCSSCKKGTTKQSAPQSSVCNPTIETILASSEGETMERKIDKIILSQQFISNTLDEMNQKYQVILTENNALRQQADLANAEISSLQKKVSLLENIVHSREQETLNSCAIITGIPSVKNEKKENLLKIVEKFGEIIKANFTAADIQDVYRTGKTNNVVIKFSNTALKIDLMRKNNPNSKENRQNEDNKHLPVIAQHLGFGNEPHNVNKIYVNNQYTQYYYNIFKSAKMIKRDKQYAFLWFDSNANHFFMQKSATTSKIKIRSLSDLNKL